MNHLIKSRFRGVYLSLSLLWLALTIGLVTVIDKFVAPEIKNTKTQNIEALVHSHMNAIQLNDTRAIRDELIRQKVISDDRDFELLRPSKIKESKQISEELRNCDFINQQSCVSATKTIILSDSVGSDFSKSSFAILLNSSYFSSVGDSLGWKVFGSIVFALVFALIAWGIRQQENFLLKKTNLLSDGFQKVESFFNVSNMFDPNEPDLLTETIAQASATLIGRTKQIEMYKKYFENKTRIEQLAQTVAYTSHNLKAPLQEGADFLKDLPEFIEKMPKDVLNRSIRSLENRLRVGAEDLQKALTTTKEAEARTEKVRVDDLIKSFKNRIETNPNLQSVAVSIQPSTTINDSVSLNVSEMDAALWNLAKNSIEAKQDAQLSLLMEQLGNEVIIHFKDDGPGIPSELSDRIFDDFYTTKARGSGLGLASVKKTIEKANGRIQVKASNSGAHFEIRLPLVATSVSEVPHA